MTPEQQRIAIAKACGWKFHSLTEHSHWHTECLPNYTKDLNAMHEAEKVLTESQQSVFADMLNSLHKVADLTYPEPSTRGFRKDLFSEAFHLIHATAAQRAEAFLRTLSLWEE